MNDLRGAMGKARASTIVASTIVPIAGEDEGDSRLPSRLRKWGSEAHLSSAVARLEAFLADRGFERMPWLAVAMLAGIGLWFLLPGPKEWLIAIGLCGVPAGLALIALVGDERAIIRNAVIGVTLMLAAGIVVIWFRSTLVGVDPISGPRVAVVEALVLEREEQPARGNVRLVVATRDPMDQRAIRARLNISEELDESRLLPGVQFRAKIRLVPPQRAAIPGGYDFAQMAWFEGWAASGSVLEAPDVSNGRNTGSHWRSDLAGHVRERVGQFGRPASAAIAATLITGDRGAIPASDAQAMRDSGLAHMLSISGLHVGAIVAIAWVLVVRTGALFPWLALRVRLPLAAAFLGALAGIAYTVLTGAALPTVRACIAALLVVGALALGRQALSLRLIALAAIAVMLFWPEAVIGPSFQLSFAAVIAIVALHNSRFIESLRVKRGGGRMARLLHAAILLFLTGLVVEATLTPLVLFHFQRSGIYGAVANVLAIPIMTAVTLPALIAGLALDWVGLGLGLGQGLGLGAPAWWLAAKTLDLIIAIAHGTSSLPGSVVEVPQIALWAVLACAAGGLWVALWSGRFRLWGLAPLAVGVPALFFAQPSDLLIEQSGRNLALMGRDGQVYLLRNSSSFAAVSMLEAMGETGGFGHGKSGEGAAGAAKSFPEIPDWPGARCNGDFCAIEAAGRQILIAQRPAEMPYQPVVDACAYADIVIASRRLPADCRPAMLKADGSLLSRRGGLAVNLGTGSVRAVRPEGDRHGW